MKKILFTCFLGGLCLFGSEVQSKVASPWSTPVPALDTVGQGRGALIYGEIINPDSLAPLKILFTPYYVDSKSGFLQEEIILELQPGEFFDGVLNPMVMKFSATMRLTERPDYFSLLLEDRPFLENYLIFPGDSIKISIDLMRMDLLFEGSNAAFYEAQHAIKREQKRRSFREPRQLITKKASPMLQKPENQAKMLEFEGQFGSKLLILEPGWESLDYLLDGMEGAELELHSQLAVLDHFAHRLSREQYDLLKTELYSGFYHAGLSSFRKFHYPAVMGTFSPAEKEQAIERIEVILEGIKDQGFMSSSKLISARYLELALEKIILKALLEEKSFLTKLDEEFEGELADRLRAGYLSLYLSALPNQEKAIGDFLAVTQTSPWKDRIESLKNSHIPGDRILPIELRDTEGKIYSEKELLGKPTLLYFYFSTCSHSATYFQKFLFPLYQETQDLGYQLIAISVDKDIELWKSRIEKYSDPSLLNLNLRDEAKVRWRNYYELHAYPKTMLLDAEGKIISFDIGNLGTNYESLRTGFLNLYQSQIADSPLTDPNL